MSGAPARDAPRVIAGRYELEVLLGQGGMGEVWRAKHLALKSHVALKLLHGAVASDPMTRERFVTEAQVTAKLKTRHAVQVFDFGITEEGQPYLVMELVEGEGLDRRLARDLRIPRADTVKILGRAARALDRAHVLGIVHRDFKPENIMVFADEEGGDDVKVVDFGVAKILGELEAENERTGAVNPLTSKSRTQNLVGTPYYMSPEQINDPTKVGPAADIWAFGVVAFECLTGARPFEDDTIPGLLRRILRAEPIGLGSDLAHLPKEFDEWFRAACAPDPALRFPDAQTALTALAVVLDVPAPAHAKRAEAMRSLPDVASMTPLVKSSAFSDTVDAATTASGIKKRPTAEERSSLAASMSASGAPFPAVAPPPKRAWKIATAAVAVTLAAVAFIATRSSETTPRSAAPSDATSTADRGPRGPETAGAAEPGATAAPANAATQNHPEPVETPAATPAPRGVLRGKLPGHPAASASPSASARASATPSAAPVAPPPEPPKPASSSPFQLPPLGL